MYVGRDDFHMRGHNTYVAMDVVDDFVNGDGFRNVDNKVGPFLQSPPLCHNELEGNMDFKGHQIQYLHNEVHGM
jgi:hypothetical protein